MFTLYIALLRHLAWPSFWMTSWKRNAITHNIIYKYIYIYIYTYHVLYLITQKFKLHDKVTKCFEVHIQCRHLIAGRRCDLDYTSVLVFALFGK